MTNRMGPPKSATPVHPWSLPIEFPLLFSAQLRYAHAIDGGARGGKPGGLGRRAPLTRPWPQSLGVRAARLPVLGFLNEDPGLREPDRSGPPAFDTALMQALRALAHKSRTRTPSDP